MEFIFFGIDSLIVSGLYLFYKKKSRVLSNIESAPEINLYDKNSIKDVVDYGMIVGKVEPENLDLNSHFNDNYSGVIRILEIKEHGTSWRNNISADTKRTISHVINDVPFSLVNKKIKNLIRIQVSQPLEADYLLNYLDLSHTHFEPIKQSIFSKIVNSIATNETIRGIETTEYMLKNGTQLTAFGKIEKLPTSWLSTSQTPQYRLSKPEKSGFSYILTPLSRIDLIDKLRSTTKTLKIFLIIFGSIGAGLGIYIAYKLITDYIEKKKRQNQIAHARLQRIKNQRARARDYDNENINSTNVTNSKNSQNHTVNNQIQSNNDTNESSLCVICLINPRELVLLDCGHVCLCMDCYEKMPNKNCPICRAKYRSFLPCYIP